MRTKTKKCNAKTFDYVDGSTLSISKSIVNNEVMTTTIVIANATN